MNYLEQRVEIPREGTYPLRLRRRVPINLSTTDEEYICGKWQEEGTGNVWLYNIDTAVAWLLFKGD